MTPVGPRITIGLSDVALAVIAIFVVLAYFNGWGSCDERHRPTTSPTGLRRSMTTTSGARVDAHDVESSGA